MARAPANVNSYFVVDATLAKKWAEEHPLLTPNDLQITADVMLTYFDDQGNRYESSPISQKIIPGEKTQYSYEIAQNPDGTYTPKMAPISWEYIFKDPIRGARALKISTDDKFFQFVAPDKDFGVRHDAKMTQLKQGIIICYDDKQMRLTATAADDKTCLAIAWDKQTCKTYYLIQHPPVSTLTIYCKDAKGKPISGASVYLSGCYKGQTDSNGNLGSPTFWRARTP